MRSVWAVASNTIAQAVRMKVAVIFAILLIILLPVMALIMTGDGTVKGKLQTFVSYGLSLTTFLLCLLTIIISAYSITSDITGKQIYTVVTKPVRRSQILCGKLLGIILLDTILLAVFACLIYGFAVGIRNMADAPPEQIKQADNEFFTARASLTPAVADVRKEVAEVYRKLERLGQLPQNLPRSKILNYLVKQKQLEKRAAAPGNELLWQFYGIKPLGNDDTLFIRFKYDVSAMPPDKNVYSRWYIGDDRKYRLGLQDNKSKIYFFDRKDAVDTFYEIAVPGDAVAEDGYLAVVFQNLPMNNTVVIFPFEDGLEVLYKAGSFTVNYIKVIVLILARLIFLATLAVFAASWLSFPVTILICLVVFFTGTISGFILESFDFLAGGFSNVYDFTVRPIISLLPRFDRFNPAEFIVPGRLLSLAVLADVVFVLVCIKALLLFLAGVLIFTYREIARVTV